MPMRQGDVLASRVLTWLRDSFWRSTTLLVEADEVERVFADVDADCRNGFKAGGLA
jgi:hypothetical protein